MHRPLLALPATAFTVASAVAISPAARAEAPLFSGTSILTPGIVGSDTRMTRDGILRPNTVLTQRQTMSAITDQVSMLARLRDWRGTFSGSGQRAKRQWTLASTGQQKLQLAIGAQALPRFLLAGLPSTAVGTSIQMGRFAAGTTWRPRELDEMAAQYDSLMTGEAPTATATATQTPWAWFSARPVQTKSGSIDVLHARRSQDGHDSLFSGARGEWQAPLRWKVNGEWSQSQNDENEGRAWSLGATGPVRHLWGEATATASVKEVQPRYVGWDGTTQEATQNGSLALQQNIACGDLSGTMLFTVAQTRPLSDIAAQNIALTQIALTQQAQSNTDLRWKLTPSLSVITRHSLKSTAERLETAVASPLETTDTTPAGPAASETEPLAGQSAANPVQEAAPLPLAEPASPADDTSEVAPYPAKRDAWQMTEEQSADAGLEWKWSRSLALSATAGQTRSARRLMGDAATPASGFAPGADACNHISLGLQRRTAGGSWSIGLSRQLQEAADAGSIAPAPTNLTDGVQVAGERSLGPGLKIKGSYGVTSNHTLAEQLMESRVARSLEAQWSLDMGRIDFGVSDSYGMTTALGVVPDGTREWTARFNLGSANKGNGLGLAVEYALQQQAAAEATPVWRVGVTYK